MGESERLEKILRNKPIVLGPNKKQKLRGKNAYIYGLVFTILGLFLLFTRAFIIGVIFVFTGFSLLLYGKKLRKIKLTGYLDTMGPYDFEILVADLFSKEGYNCRNLKSSGDQGADILASKNGRKHVIQVKHYSINNKISSGTVRDVYGAMGMYNALKGIIVTTSYFTNPSHKTSKKLGIELIDRDQLKPLLVKHYYYEKK